MNKSLLIAAVLTTIIIAGCGMTPKIITPEDTSTFSMISGQVTKYPYKRKMNKPDMTGMQNRNALQNGFHESWKMTYILPKIDISDPVYQEQCKKNGFILINGDNGNELKKIPYKDFKSYAKFDVSDKYNGQGLGLEFSLAQKKFLNAHGRMILKANSGFLETMINTIPYEGDGNETSYGGDERADNYGKIGGSALAYQRYPYNTILVTSDLLLHIYHKVFDNSLKYYEETKARPMLSKLSASLFEKFSELAQKTTDNELKKNYEFLAAYRAIPHTILMSNTELIDKITTESEDIATSDLSDEQVQKLIRERSKIIFTKLSPSYKEAANMTLEELLKANNSDGENILLKTHSSNLLESFGEFNSLKFDFTQFKPRAHYTTSSLLKTYFMAMKWMMREKLYFADKNVALSALIMINNIKNEDLKEFTTFYTFIQKLIGEDDDVNITDMQKFIADQKRSSDAMIVKGMKGSVQEKLVTLRPQRIMSVSYSTPTEWAITEQQAKDITAGFVFFGEKFTIDSRFFDQFTAGSAEKESNIKPWAQSALMVADMLINTPITKKFANLWLQKNQSAFEITQEQAVGYTSTKGVVSKNEILTKFDFGASIYHSRLTMLSTLFISEDNNAPYFIEDPLYQNKVLNTYLGNYTELKHDTLLYIKQAYAELGGGGDGPCVWSVAPPALPVPKGYIEASVNLIDKIIALTQETNAFFSGIQYQQFMEYLNLVRKIALAQTQNKKTSNDDFESLRLAESTLTTITTPTKLFGQAVQKEKRGSIIADIFTSGKYGPLYEAVGRPYLMVLMVNDSNGARVVLGPIFSHYEFYAGQAPFEATGGGRFTDQDRQNNYDALKGKTELDLLSLPLQEIMQTIKTR